ncbi:phage tail protein I [Paenibacillus daejeonensis]|uniref:phage tail protein I n=1 Tax=Paenibacillus daejeonensis TaxID=135193 RepID=UPI0003671046|nr:phage tail protein I [Paenibacillus daejeonensis]
MINVEQIRLIDLIPPNLRSDPNVRAAAEALDSELEQITALTPRLTLLANIDQLDESLIDELAWQLHVDFYDPELPLEQKQDLVRFSLRWHKRKGTPSAVNELISTIFGSGTVVEWYEYGGEPGYFRVRTSDPSANADRAAQFLAAINSVKNERSWLEAIEITTEGFMNLRFGIAAHIGKHLTARQVV